MCGLSRLRARLGRGAHDERGAAAIVIAVLLSGGVIMGMLAVSVDVGNIMSERRQLQNGADATSLALAQECAADATECDPAQVEDLLGANARDDAAQYDDRATAPTGACARGTTEQVGALAAALCPSSSGGGDMADLGECTPLPTWLRDEPDIPYVETYAATETTTGDDELFLPFSRVLAGDASGDASVSACARAAWGPLGSSRPSLPLVIGQCNWDIATADGTRLMESPPYSPAPNPGTTVPALKDRTGTEHQPADFLAQIFGKVNGSETSVVDKFECEPELTNPPGAYGPGGFGWLTTCGDDPGRAECEGVTDPCHAPIPGSGEASSKTGASVPTACKNSLATFVGKEVDVPVVTDWSGTGSNLKFTVDGVSTFYFAGYHEVSSASPKEKDAYNPKVSAYYEKACVDSSGKFYKSTCIWGWFTSPVRSVGDIDPGATPRGPVTVKPAG